MGPWNMHHDDEHYRVSGDEWRHTGPAVAPFPVADVLELGKRRSGVFALRVVEGQAGESLIHWIFRL
jgi:hypothetical protein